MSFEQIIADDYGQVAKITFIDVDSSTGAAADISTYSDTIEMIFTDPSGNEASKTAAFDTDGTDGVIKYTIETGVLDEAGNWRVRGRVTNTGNAVLSTEEHVFPVAD